MQTEREPERAQQPAFNQHSFNQESLHSILTEVLPLLQHHYKEIAFYQDIELKPEFDTYYKLEELGLLKIFTLRDSKKALCGYAAFIIRKAIHYTDSIQAHQDVLFLKEELRGKGLGHVFINYCDSELKRMGVQVVFHHVTGKHDYSSTLKGLGYELNEIVFSRRLDK